MRALHCWRAAAPWNASCSSGCFLDDTSALEMTRWRLQHTSVDESRFHAWHIFRLIHPSRRSLRQSKVLCCPRPRARRSLELASCYSCHQAFAAAPIDPGWPVQVRRAHRARIAGLGVGGDLLPFGQHVASLDGPPAAGGQVRGKARHREARVAAVAAATVLPSRAPTRTGGCLGPAPAVLPPSRGWGRTVGWAWPLARLRQRPPAPGGVCRRRSYPSAPQPAAGRPRQPAPHVPPAG